MCAPGEELGVEVDEGAGDLKTTFFLVVGKGFFFVSATATAATGGGTKSIHAFSLSAIARSRYFLYSGHRRFILSVGA